MGKEDPKARVQHMHHNTNLKYDKHYIFIECLRGQHASCEIRDGPNGLARAKVLQKDMTKYILPESSVDKCFITLINYCLRHMIL